MYFLGRSSNISFNFIVILQFISPHQASKNDTKNTKQKIFDWQMHIKTEQYASLEGFYIV